MKILLISHFVPYPPHGGSLQRNFNLLRELARDNEVHLVTFNQQTLLPQDQLEEGLKTLRQYCSSISVYPVPTDGQPLRWYALLLFNLFSREPYSVWRFRSRDMMAEIKRLLSHTDFDLVYADTIAIAEYATLAQGQPLALNHHNVESSLLLRRAANETNPLKRFYIRRQGNKLRRYERLMASRFDLNITVSDIDRDELRHWVLAGRHEVIANGSDTDYFTPGTREHSRELIYAGGMTWYPNRDAMIYFCRDIFPHIKKDAPDAIMNVIGSHPADEVVTAGKKDQAIRVHGFVDDVRPYLRDSAVYVVPIRVGGGTRLKILDAFAAGKAMVSTSIGCEGIAVTPEEDILIADSPTSFSRQVIRLLNDDALREKLETKARQLVEEKYAWTIIGRKLNQVYRELVS